MFTVTHTKLIRKQVQTWLCLLKERCTASNLNMDIRFWADFIVILLIRIDFSTGYSPALSNGSIDGIIQQTLLGAGHAFHLIINSWQNTFRDRSAAHASGTIYWSDDYPIDLFWRPAFLLHQLPLLQENYTCVTRLHMWHRASQKSCSYSYTNSEIYYRCQLTYILLYAANDSDVVMWT